MSTMKELGNRAVACKHWEWLPGMLTLETARDEQWRIDGQRGRLLIRGACFKQVTSAGLSARDLPDLADSATGGCLMRLVLDAYKAVNFSVTYRNETTNTPEAGFLSYWEAGYFTYDRPHKAKGTFQHGVGDFDRLWALGLVCALEAAP